MTLIDPRDLSGKALAAMMDALNPGTGKFVYDTDRVAFELISREIARRWQREHAPGNHPEEFDRLVEEVGRVATDFTPASTSTPLGEAVGKIAALVLTLAEDVRWAGRQRDR